MPDVGISACLIGQKVRYDGGHKRSEFCHDELSQHVKLVPFCPEVGIGLGVPRPTIRLQQSGDGVRAVIAKSGEDVTARLAHFADSNAVAFEHLSGYVLCARSPSCGMERVRIYPGEGNAPVQRGTGIFARRLQELYPALPVEEDGRLNDLHLRENFVMRVFVYARWKALPEALSKHELMQFHACHKYLLLAHNQAVYRQLGRRLAQAASIDAAFCQAYITDLMGGLSRPASRQNHTNVLQHIQGYFSSSLSAAEREEMSDLILQYHQGQMPLMAPLTLIQHYLRKHPNEYLAGQVYLTPYPGDLKLRYGL